MGTSVDVKNMLNAAVHFGHKTSKWHPKMKPYLHGSREGIHIIDLFKTKSHLDVALNFLSKIVAEGQTVLVVATKPQASTIVAEKCRQAGIPFVTHKWISGLLTNFSTVKSRIKYLKRLKDDEASGEITKYTKKEITKLKKDKIKLEQALGGLGDMTGLPDAVFVLDAVGDRIAITEAAKCGIPVIAVCDSNADPDGIDYVVPGNDDSVKSIQFFMDALVSSIKPTNK